MQSRKHLFESQAHLNCWIDARRRDGPPDDSRREVRKTVNCNVKVAYLSALARHLPTPRATS